MAKKTKGYFSSLGNDLPSALVVFLVALPLCLGIALASGAPLFSGIIAGVVGGIIVGSLSGSNVSVSGPAAGLTTIVAAAILKLNVYEAFLLAVSLAGIIQLALGFLKAGVIGDYVPGSVIKGMLAAIGLILILKQMPHLVGYDADFEGNEAFAGAGGENTFTGIWHSFNYIVPAAVVIGIAAILIQILWDKVLVKKGRIFSLIPAPLVVVLMGVGVNEFLLATNPAYAIQASHLVSIPSADSFSGFISFFSFPDFSFLTNAAVWTSAITIAIVASLETLLNLEAADELDPYQRNSPTNRELKAQGFGNLISGLIGGLPVTSVIVRTSANVNAGARTKVSAVMHGVLLLACVALIPGLLNKIPYSALAGILVYTGYKLAKPSLFKTFYAKGWNQFIPFVVTIAAILLTDLLVGIIIGICVGLFFVLRSNFKTAVHVVHDENRYLFRLRKDVSFLNKPIIKQKLESVPDDSYVLIDISRADFIDLDVVDIIEDFMIHAPLKNITVDLKKSVHNGHGFNESVLNGEMVMAKQTSPQ